MTRLPPQTLARYLSPQLELLPHVQPVWWCRLRAARRAAP